MSDDEDQIVTDDERQMFDQLLDHVMSQLPPHLHKLLDEVPLIVEDYPSDEVLDELEINDPSGLCGLHTGIPLTERSVLHSGHMPDTINLYREGILNMAADRKGRVRPQRLEKQIRITLLHEIGHHFGLDEDDLRELGYD